jgi:Fe-S cluster biogenesis protein NfuA
VQELQGRLDAAPDSETRDVADELVSAVVQLYGEGLQRLVGRLMESGEEGGRIAAGLAEDPLLATLLLIHDLHPVPLAQRVQEALESVRPYMESHGGGVELLSLEDGVATLHLEGSCSDCSASSVTLELAIKQALEERAPDLVELIVEGVAPQMTGLSLPMASSEPTGMELPIVMSGPGLGAEPPPPAAEPAWWDLDGLDQLGLGELTALTLGGMALVVANVDGTLLAFQDACAACGSELREGKLSEGSLACPACERVFFLPRAGRTLDAERLQLTPVPLLRDGGSVKVALAL